MANISLLKGSALTYLKGLISQETDRAVAAEGNLQQEINGKAPTTHNHTASQISDASTSGRAMITAQDAAAQRTLLGLGDASGAIAKLVEDLNTALISGWYYATSPINGPPVEEAVKYQVIRGSHESDLMQIVYATSRNGHFIRSRYGGEWSDWLRLDLLLSKEEAIDSESTVAGRISGQRIAEAIEAQFGAASAALEPEAIGARAFLANVGIAVANPGTIIDGADLRWAGITSRVVYAGAGLPGTWKATGYAPGYVAPTQDVAEVVGATIFVRVT